MQTIPRINNILEKEVNKGICDAVGCLQKATKVITVDAGKFGKISLFLCKQCLPKFPIKED